MNGVLAKTNLTAVIAAMVGAVAVVSEAQGRSDAGRSWQVAWEARQAEQAERRRVEWNRRNYERRRATGLPLRTGLSVHPVKQGAFADGVSSAMAESRHTTGAAFAASSASGHVVPFFPSASDALGRQGFARVINHSEEAGHVTVEAVDDEGASYGTLTLTIGAGETVHFNSDDLEDGNAGNGLAGSTGPGQGDWRLELESDLDIEVQSYIRTTDGFLTAMHDTVPEEDGRHDVVIFNPGSNRNQESLLRLVNPGDVEAEVTIAGVDDNGESPGEGATVTVPAGTSRTYTAAELESGGAAGLGGSLGDGSGKWRLVVDSDQAVVAMSLLSSPTGHLTNLSAAPSNEREGVHLVWLLPPASDPLGRQGFVRVINHSAEAVEVSVAASDETEWEYEPVVLTVGANAAAHFNSDDLEQGNESKGLSAGVGAGEGDWRLELAAEADIEVLSYVRTRSGFVTAMDGVAVQADDGSHHYYLPFFHPADHAGQESHLRLINTGDEEAGITIRAMDDGGESAPEGVVGPSLGAGRSLTLTAGQLEQGAEDLSGRLGDGSGSWQVWVDADMPIEVMGLGHAENGLYANLSLGRAGYRAWPLTPDLEVSSFSASDTSPHVGESLTLTATVNNRGDADSSATTLRYYRSTNSTISSVDTEVDTDRVARLAAGGSSGSMASLSAPSAGTYYYGACVDAVQTEADATNNCSSGVAVTVRNITAPGPDLVVASASVDEARPHPGDPIELSATVSNVGGSSSAATTLRYYRSDDAAILTTDTEIGTDTVTALPAAGRSGQSIMLESPGATGTYQYGACVDRTAGETDAANNCSTAVAVTVTAPPRPDLVVESTSLSDDELEVGGAFTLSATVRNRDNGASSATTVRYYRSVDSTISATDSEVGTDGVEGLAALGVSVQQVELTAPAEPGTYYYGACVDVVVDEADTTNNCSASREATVSGHPDLVVRAPSVDDDRPLVGGSILLSARVRNRGNVGADATTLRYHQSADSTITTEDAEVGTDAVDQLAASGTIDRSIVLTAPSDSGTYHYGACVDAVVGEANTANNCSSPVIVAVESGPDLVVQSPSVTQDIILAGDGFTHSVTVTNVGDRDAAETTLRYYRSEDATISMEDTPVGTGPVTGLAASGSSDESVILNAPSIIGRYYYGACVDGVVDESDTENNCSPSVQVTVRGYPDLVVELPSVSESVRGVGGEFTLSATIRNQGDGGAAATTLRYYRSADATISTADMSVGTGPVTGLAASGSSDESVILNAPSIIGRYYYGACVDGVVDESDTENNCSPAVRVTVRGYPDLVVESPSVSESNPVACADLTLSATVRNQGDGGAAATSLRYYHSTDTAISRSDTRVDKKPVESLAASDSTTESADITAPSDLGTHYYGACVDNVEDESDTTNNCSSSVQIVVPMGAPDLIVDEFRTIPEDAQVDPGESFSLAAQVTNVGTGMSARATVRYFRSTDSTITTTDDTSGRSQVFAICPSSSDHAQVTAFAPSTPGTYYYGACVDSVRDESDTTNNCSLSVEVEVL